MAPSAGGKSRPDSILVLREAPPAVPGPLSDAPRSQSQSPAECSQKRDGEDGRHDPGHGERAGQVPGVDEEPDAEHGQREARDDGGQDSDRQNTPLQGGPQNSEQQPPEAIPVEAVQAIRAVKAPSPHPRSRM